MKLGQRREPTRIVVVTLLTGLLTLSAVAAPGWLNGPPTAGARAAMCGSAIVRTISGSSTDAVSLGPGTVTTTVGLADGSLHAGNDQTDSSIQMPFGSWR
jgi:hypothetical protein